MCVWFSWSKGTNSTKKKVNDSLCNFTYAWYAVGWLFGEPGGWENKDPKIEQFQILTMNEPKKRNAQNKKYALFRCFWYAVIRVYIYIVYSFGELSCYVCGSLNSRIFVILKADFFFLNSHQRKTKRRVSLTTKWFFFFSSFCPKLIKSLTRWA